MSFYRSPICLFNVNYSISGVLFEPAGASVNNLGITFDRCLRFNAYLDKMSCNAMKILRYLLRMFGSFVRSLLEYGVVIWCPTTMNHSYQHERVQRKFLKCVSFWLSIDCPPHDYNPVLFRLGLITLPARRVKISLLLVSLLEKLIDGRID
jgi:hypothetical protein